MPPWPQRQHPATLRLLLMMMTEGMLAVAREVEFLRVDRSPERSGTVYGTGPGGWIEGVSEESRSGV